MKNKTIKPTAFELQTFDSKSLNTKKVMETVMYNLELKKLLQKEIYDKHN